MLRFKPLDTLYLQATSSFVYLLDAKRFYTPIFQPGPLKDHLKTIRTREEVKCLWQDEIIIPTISRAVEYWLRFGNDPLTHTATPVRIVGKYYPVEEFYGRESKGALNEERLKMELSTSPFSTVEDDNGTNLVSKIEENVKESVSIWMSFFEARYLNKMRESRRNAIKQIGLMNADSQLRDEADDPHTKWASDSHFGELAYLSEKHLKEKIPHLRAFEQVLWEKASPESFLSFFDSFQLQTQTLIPLPSPSVWYYTEERRAAWVEKYLPISSGAREFFDGILAGDVKRLGQDKVLHSVAEAYKEIVKILVARHERQKKSGIFPQNWNDADETTQEIVSMNEVERTQRRVQDGVFDVTDTLDTTEEWQKEHEMIESILGKTVEGCKFKARDFWLYTWRREEMETEHVHSEERIRKVSAAALRKLYSEVPYDRIVSDLYVSSVAKGQIDLQAAVFKPHFNPTWCKLHYAKFGSSSVTHHTTTNSRILFYNYANSTAEIAATATLYYHTKPLSSSVDYSSPYKYRQSIANHCASYGLTMHHALHRRLFLSCDNLTKAEECITRVRRDMSTIFGNLRRQQLENKRLRSKTLLTPLKDVQVCHLANELLDSGAPDDDILQVKSAKEPVHMWVLGSRNAVRYHWPSTILERLRLQATSAPLSAEHQRELSSLCQQARVEVSLWRKLSVADIETRRARVESERNHLKVLLKEVPLLLEIQAYCENVYSKLTGITPSLEEKSAALCETDLHEYPEEKGWDFVTMLDDRATINVAQELELYMPFKDSEGKPLPQGEYRIRVRIFELDSGNHEDLAAMGSVGYSDPFPVFDALPQLLTQYLRLADGDPLPTVISGSELVPLAQFLRDGGIDVPVFAEFEAGQYLDQNGNVFLEKFLELIRSSKYHDSNANQGITQVQKEIEPLVRAHWELYHPGANGIEWAAVRRSELNRATQKERNWWFSDPMLGVNDQISYFYNGFNLTMYPATVRYGQELCSVLTAEGTNEVSHSTGGNSERLRATCSVDGTGAITDLAFQTHTSTSSFSLENALSCALGAIQNAQNRHHTLASVKLAPYMRQAQVVTFCNAQNMEFGGKGARTYCYAFEKAKKEIAETLASGREAPHSIVEAVERLSETTKVDRFASDSHPELRNTRFAPRTTIGGILVDDPHPNDTSTFGQ